MGCVGGWATPAANRAPKHGWQMAADLVHDGDASVGLMLGRRRSKLGKGRGWIWPVQAALRSADLACPSCSEVGGRQWVVVAASGKGDL